MEKLAAQTRGKQAFTRMERAARDVMDYVRAFNKAEAEQNRLIGELYAQTQPPVMPVLVPPKAEEPLPPPPPVLDEPEPQPEPEPPPAPKRRRRKHEGPSQKEKCAAWNENALALLRQMGPMDYHEFAKYMNTGANACYSKLWRLERRGKAAIIGGVVSLPAPPIPEMGKREASLNAVLEDMQ